MPRVMDPGGVTHDLKPKRADSNARDSGTTLCGIAVVWDKAHRSRGYKCTRVAFKSPRSTVSCLWCMAKIVRS